MLLYVMQWVTAFFVALGGWGGVEPEQLPQTSVSVGTTTATVVQVIDGDTIDVRIGNNLPVTRVRYIGIDTPEPYAHGAPDCGSYEATARNKTLVMGATVTVVPGIDPYDKYDRLLAYVYIGDVFVNRVLLEEGWARMMMIRPNTDMYENFSALQTSAKHSKIGIWGLCPQR